jgi:hypothetical protein
LAAEVAEAFTTAPAARHPHTMNVLHADALLSFLPPTDQSVIPPPAPVVLMMVSSCSAEYFEAGFL